MWRGAMRRFSGFEFLALLLFIGLLLSACGPDSAEESEEASRQHLLQMALCPYLGPPDMVFEDMGDGTIRKQVISSYNSGLACVTNTSIIYEEYIMKCLYGQLYRPVENDCRGTGTAPLWGAIALAFCNTADRSCDVATDLYNPYTYDYDSEWFADPLTSPAAAACASSGLAGKEWKLPWGVSIYGENVQVFPDNLAKIQAIRGSGKHFDKIYEAGYRAVMEQL